MHEVTRLGIASISPQPHTTHPTTQSLTALIVGSSRLRINEMKRLPSITGPKGCTNRASPNSSSINPGSSRPHLAYRWRLKWRGFRQRRPARGGRRALARKCVSECLGSSATSEDADSPQLAMYNEPKNWSKRRFLP